MFDFSSVCIGLPVSTLDVTGAKTFIVGGETLLLDLPNMIGVSVLLIPLYAAASTRYICLKSVLLFMMVIENNVRLL
jgi:hypothetical protein